MSKLFLSILIGSILCLAACSKDDFATEPAEACQPQTDNPAGRSYKEDSVITFSFHKKTCGILPLSRNNYWVYEDSVFNNGIFVNIKMDTLRYTSTWKSLKDSLIWWESNGVFVGIPGVVYANDSSFYTIADRVFAPGIVDAKKDYSLFPGDSIRYLASFEDGAAQGRSLKLSTPVASPAGSFSGCVYFEKNARNYRKDQVYFKPGVGVIKYIHEKAPMGDRHVKLQQVSTLVSFHIE